MATITRKNIESVLAFLHGMQDENYCTGKWKTEKGAMPAFISSENTTNFIQALYDNGFILPFNWIDWVDKANELQDSKEALSSAGIDDVVKLLTYHVSQDRFIDGHIASVVSSGHIAKILERLQKLSEEI